MFERFTDRARRVVVLAQEHSRMLGHSYNGTEHLLLGLIYEGEGVASRALKALGIEGKDVIREINEIIGTGTTPPSGHIPFTPRAKKVLELSLREALQLGHNYIGTEHLLLGLIREGEGVAAQVLVKLGADLNGTRAKVIELLNGYAQAAREKADRLPVDEKSLYVQAREIDAEGHERPRVYDYALANMTYSVHDGVLALKFHDGTEINHNLRYIEQYFTG